MMTVVILTLLDIDPFDPSGLWGRFVPPVGSALRRNAGHFKRRAMPLTAKSARPLRVGHIGAAGGPGSFWAALTRHLGLGGSRIAPRAAPARAGRFAP